MKLEVIISVYLNTVFIYFVPFLLYPDALHELVWSLPARPEGHSPSAPGPGMTLAEHRWHAGASSQFHLFYAFVYRYHLPLRANQGAARGRTPPSLHPCFPSHACPFPLAHGGWADARARVCQGLPPAARRQTGQVSRRWGDCPCFYTGQFTILDFSYSGNLFLLNSLKMTQIF